MGLEFDDTFALPPLESELNNFCQAERNSEAQRPHILGLEWRISNGRGDRKYALIDEVLWE